MNLFYGDGYNPKLDTDRLLTQHEKIFNLMIDHQWRTLREISNATMSPEASVSAQLRSFRKIIYGGYIVESRRADNGLHEYRLLEPIKAKGEQLELFSV